jgi:hypothetical protein
VATCVTAAEVWKEINAMFASQSHARTIQLCTRLATTRKGDLSADAYYSKMKGIADEMAAAGKPPVDEDFVSYVLTRLDQDYNSFIENRTSKEEISLGSMYSQLLDTEALLDRQSTQSQLSVNATTWGHGAYCDCGRHDGGRGGFGRGFGGLGENGSSLGTKLVRQLCKKTGHMVLRC